MTVEIIMASHKNRVPSFGFSAGKFRAVVVMSSLPRHVFGFALKLLASEGI